MAGGFNPIGMLTGGGAGGGGLGGILGSIGGLAQTLAPLANFILPGIGPMIAQVGGGLLQGAGSFVSKMEDEAQQQKQLDKKESANAMAANEDMGGAANFLNTVINPVGAVVNGVLG